jgi:hypothetical protein
VLGQPLLFVEFIEIIETVAQSLANPTVGINDMMIVGSAT